MHATLTFDPTDPRDIATTRSVLDSLAASSPTSPSRGTASATSNGPAAGMADDDLKRIIAAIADGHTYGKNRRGYLRGLAEAGAAGIDIGEWKSTHFEDSHQKYGGTHSSIEKSWRALGGESFAPELIWEQAGRQFMVSEARELVLAYTADLAD